MELEKHFGQNREEVFNSWKKAGKDAYFQLLDYGALFTPEHSSIDEKIKTRRTKELRKAYNTLYKEDSFGASDTWYWRKAIFNDVCSASISLCNPDIEGKPFAYNFFKFSKAQISFQNICRKFSFF